MLPLVTLALSPTCHPEHIRYTQCKLREGSDVRGCEILHFVQNDKGGLSMTGLGVEMLRCDQHDNRATFASPAGDHKDHSYGSSGILPVFMA